MKVIIPIAGEGKRLRPHTYTKPKPLLPVAGKPIIDHIMDIFLPLKPNAFYFITGHLRQRMEHHLEEKYGKQTTLYFREQKVLNGTAGAVDLANDAFDEDVIIDFGDTIFAADLSVIKDCKDDAIIWAMHVEDYQRFGVIVTDKNGHMIKIVEKPKEPISKLANIGLYYVKNSKLLAEGIKHVLAHPVPGKESYLTDAFQYMIDHGAKIKVLPCEGWFDTGAANTILETNQLLLERYKLPVPTYPGVTIIPPVAIHPSAKIEKSVIGPYVSVGANVTITDSIVKSSIIDDSSTIVHAKLNHSIIGVEARVSGSANKVVIGDHSLVE